MTGFGRTAQTWSLVAFCAAVSVTLLLCVLTGPDHTPSFTDMRFGFEITMYIATR